MKRKIIYLLCVILGIILMIMTDPYYGLLILVILVLLPLFWCVTIHIATSNLALEGKIKGYAVNVNDKIEFSLRMYNPVAFPIPKIKAVIFVENNFDTMYTECFYMEIAGNADKTVNMILTSKYCGKCTIKIDKLVCYSFLGIFKVNKKCDFSFDIMVYPDIKPMDIDIDHNSFLDVEESDSYSKIKPGQNRNEIFDIREYKIGDPVKNIHWKLTAKAGELMVKEFSQPISEGISIILDFSNPYGERLNVKEADRLIAEAYSTAFTLVSEGMIVKLCIFNLEYLRFTKTDMHSLTEMYNHLNIVLNNGLYDKLPSYDAYKQLKRGTLQTNVFYIGDRRQYDEA